jgi:hypothetical protein
LQDAVPEQRDISFTGLYPNSSVWIGSEIMSRRDLRIIEDFPHLEIAYAHKLSRFACAFCPNIPVDVLGYPHHHSERLVIRFRDPTKSAIYEEVQSVIYSHPQVAGVVFQH